MSLQLAFAAPVALALVGAVLSLAAEAVERERFSIVLSSVALAAAAVIALVGAATVAPGAVWGVFVIGAGYSMAACIVMALGALACVASLSSPEKGRAALGGLISISAAALAVLAASNDIIVMLVALETAALSGYALVALARTPRVERGRHEVLRPGRCCDGGARLGDRGRRSEPGTRARGRKTLIGPVGFGSERGHDRHRARLRGVRVQAGSIPVPLMGT